MSLSQSMINTVRTQLFSKPATLLFFSGFLGKGQISGLFLLFVAICTRLFSFLLIIHATRGEENVLKFYSQFCLINVFYDLDLNLNCFILNAIDCTFFSFLDRISFAELNTSVRHIFPSSSCFVAYVKKIDSFFFFDDLSYCFAHPFFL